MKNGQCFGRKAAGLALGVMLALAACAPSSDITLRIDPKSTKSAPRGYIAFCTRDPSLCDGKGQRSVALSGKRWAELLRVNDAVNDLLKPSADSTPAEVADDWELPTGALPADCEDYVLAKKAQLVALGWPKPALRIAVADMRGSRHAVLFADTSAGLFVLDNLERKVLRWTEADYRWVSVQISTDPDRWAGVVAANVSR